MFVVFGRFSRQLILVISESQAASEILVCEGPILSARGLGFEVGIGHHGCSPLTIVGHEALIPTLDGVTHVHLQLRFRTLCFLKIFLALLKQTKHRKIQASPTQHG